MLQNLEQADPSKLRAQQPSAFLAGLARKSLGTCGLEVPGLEQSPKVSRRGPLGPPSVPSKNSKTAQNASEEPSCPPGKAGIDSHRHGSPPLPRRPPPASLSFQAFRGAFGNLGGLLSSFSLITFFLGGGGEGVGDLMACSNPWLPPSRPS